MVRPVSSRTYACIAILVIGASFAYLAQLSWLKWTDILVDSGRELYVPGALLKGRILYWDIYYIYGPFSPYFNALLYKIFGVHAYVLAAGGYCAILAILTIVYALSRLFLNRWLALFTACSFLYLFPFGHYTRYQIFHYVIPYSYPAVHVLLFSLAAFFFFYRYLLTERSGFIWMVSLCLFLAALTKVEVALWLAISLFLGMISFALSKGKTWWQAGGYALRWAGLPLTAAAIVYGLFYLPTSNPYLLNNLTDSFLSNISTAQSSFAAKLFTGGNSVLDQLKALLMILLQFGLLAGTWVMVGHYCDKLWQGSGYRRVWGMAVAGGSLLFGAAIIFWSPFNWALRLFYPVPVLCVLTVTLCIGGWWQGKKETRIFLACLGGFALLMLSRNLLNTFAGSYGFCLLVPGFLVYQILFFRIIPDISGSLMAARLLRLGFAGLGLYIIVGHLAYTREAYASINVKLENHRGALLFNNQNGIANYRELVEDLSRTEYKGRSLVIYPEGLWINYATGLDNPLYSYQYLPIDLATPRSIELLINEFEKYKPDFFVITDRDVREYGAETSTGYAITFGKYIRENYKPFKSYGDRVFLLIHKKNSQ